MRLLPLLMIALPFAALAQDAPPPRPAMRLFISPAGEPFRAPVDAPYPLATWFAGADHNHDGRIDLTEFTWDFDRFFDTLDTDHDGTLRSNEIERYERMVPELRGGGFAGGGFGGGRPGGGGGGHHRGGRGGGGGGGFGGGGGAGGYHGDEPDAGQDGGQYGGGQSEEPSSDTQRPQPAYVPEGGASRYEMIAIPEPVTAMDTDLSGTVTRQELHAAAARRFGILDQRQRGYLTLDLLPEPDAVRHKDGPKRRR